MYVGTDRVEQAGQVHCVCLLGSVDCGHSLGHMADESNKLTLRRLEAPIHKFINVALPTDLERLQKHHNNILKVTPQTWRRDLMYALQYSGQQMDNQYFLSLYFSQYQRSKQWDRLHKEHINASRTVQV